MPETGYTPPSQSTLIDRITTDYNSKLPSEEGLIPFSPGWIFARVLAGAARVLHDAIAYALEQLLPTTAAEYWLGEHAAIRSVTRVAATYATGDLDFTGTNGTSLPTGTAVQRVEDGEPGTVTTGGTVSGGAVTVTIQADNAGSTANSAAGIAWELTSPITGIDSEGEVNSGTPITGGTDEEDLEDWRERVVDAWRNPPGAGTVADYKAWAKTASNVDEVFVEANELGAGTVGVRFIVDADTTTYSDGTVGPDSTTIIHDAAEKTAVEAAIDAERPITADVTVTTVTASSTNMTIDVNGLGAPPSTDIQGAIEAELHAMFIRLAAPSSTGYTIYRSQYRAAISAADGETYHDVSVPAGDISVPANQVAVLGTITWA